MPLSVTVTLMNLPSAATENWISPFSGVYFAALLSRLTKICVSRFSSARTSAAEDSVSSDSRCLFPIDDRPHLFDGVGRYAVGIEHFHVELDEPLRHARHVEQIVDQAGHVLHLPRDDLARFTDAPRIAGRGAHQLRGARNRRKRIAQFMRQHREKLILALVCKAQFLFRVDTVRDVELSDDRADHGAMLVPDRRAGAQ